MIVVPVFKELRTTDIKPMPYNPPSRVSKVALRVITRMMSETGEMLYPLLVTSDYFVIDGHRRLAVAFLLGWETVPAIIINMPAEVMYASINASHRRMTGSELLYVWFHKPAAVIGKDRKNFEDMEKVIGRALVKRFVDLGLSTFIYRTAGEVSRYVDRPDNEFVKTAVRWLLEWPITGKVREAMKTGISKRVLVKAATDSTDFDLT